MPILLDLFLTFARIGAFTFGGGYAMISIIDHECVERKKWMTEEELMEMTVLAESTPGPVAINCATYAGYRRAGFAGALSATVGMVIPSFLIILAISLFLKQFLEFTLVAKAFRGIRVAVSLLIMKVAWKMIRKLKKDSGHYKIDLLFVLGFFCFSFTMNLLDISISTIYLIIVSGLLGFCIYGLPRKGGRS